jgi:hypothetical protein
MTDEVKPKKPLLPPLSYSSMNEILGCEQKYAFRKVLELEPDDDYAKETDAMDIGSVFHTCLELCEHDLKGFKFPTLVECIEEYPDTLDLKTHGPLLWAMLRRYKLLHEDMSLKPAHIELELLAPKEYKGYVDAVLEDENGYWITDIKTAATLSRFLRSRLADDRQLNLYVHWFNKILKPEKPILGCRYRVVTKSRLKYKKVESFKQLSDRIFSGINAHEFVIPLNLMDPDSAYSTFKKVRVTQKKLHKDTVPTRNFNHCESYFRPCEYWSRCHKKQFTDDFGVKENVY